MSLILRNATSADVAAIAAIYNDYIAETLVTFEEELVLDGEMERRMTEIHSRDLPFLVAEIGNEIVGYAYANRFRDRAAYRFTVESAIYLASEQTGRGFGHTLYAGLIEALKTKSLHCVMGCIALPNEASVKLHERLGFVKSGHFPEVGFKFEKWIDVGYWQLDL
jgi:phosphinothricin acetyltransferase